MYLLFIKKVIKSYKVFESVRLTGEKPQKLRSIQLISCFGTETNSNFHARLRV